MPVVGTSSSPRIFYHKPADGLWGWGFVAVLGAAGILAGWIEGFPPAVIAVSGAFVLVVMIRIALLPTRRFSVDASGLRVTRSTMAELFTRSEWFALQDIRRIRFRSDRYEIWADSDSSIPSYEFRYFIDLFTRDGRIVNLVTSVTIAPEADLGRRIAGLLGVEYEEFLVDESR